MVSLVPDDKGNLKFGEINIFLQAAIDRFFEIQECDKETELLQIKYGIKEKGEKGVVFSISDKDYLIKSSFIDRKREKAIFQSIIMIVVFFEALINEIGVVELGSTYYKKHLDKLSILSKWEIVLTLIYGNSLDRSSQQYGYLQDVIKIRNTLVHHKTKFIQDGTDIHEVANLFERTSDYFTIISNLFYSLEPIISDIKRITNNFDDYLFYEIKVEIGRIYNHK
ncbi:hypothetical protein [uncultured Aquimarina sp.]|uniref:hypothetical protein n=1 Tax=uncultured Aquimarina sp. TaxID=575652 RepID=UPI00260C0C67|nr:hypothetical protein [uncultured Aquimarina sp.]